MPVNRIKRLQNDGSKSLKTIMLLVGCLFSLNLMAAELKVAVSANFKPVLEALVERYEAQSGDKVQISSASTGALFNQIMHGAPFDLFLSADKIRPVELEGNGKILSGSRKTYAYGQLVLWDKTPDHKQPFTIAQLKDWPGRVAIANPATAPYGLAAKQVLEKLTLWKNLKGRLVQGASIQQTWQFVASQNVQMGLVALSQVSKDDLQRITVIPEALYEPVQQEMVILKRTKQQKAAEAFAEFVLSAQSQKYIADHGYLSASSKVQKQP